MAAKSASASNGRAAGAFDAQNQSTGAVVRGEIGDQPVPVRLVQDDAADVVMRDVRPARAVITAEAGRDHASDDEKGDGETDTPPKAGAAPLAAPLLVDFSVE